MEVFYEIFSDLLCNIRNFSQNPKFHQTIPAQAVDLFTPVSDMIPLETALVTSITVVVVSSVTSVTSVGSSVTT